jgi:replicative DNA helicase
MYPAEDLVAVIDSLARVEDTGAVIIDYIQKIPLLRPSLGQRYLDIKLVSSLLLDQAVQLDIPIILGAQLGRGDKSSGSKVKLDNLRESGDIEQDANLVLGLYTKAVEDIEKEDYQDNAVRDPEVDMELTVLKNRAGVAGKSLTLSFDRPVYRITKKKTFGANSKGKTY